MSSFLFCCLYSRRNRCNLCLLSESLAAIYLPCVLDVELEELFLSSVGIDVLFNALSFPYPPWQHQWNLHSTALKVSNKSRLYLLPDVFKFPRLQSLIMSDAYEREQYASLSSAHAPSPPSPLPTRKPTNPLAFSQAKQLPPLRALLESIRLAWCDSKHLR